MRKLALVRGWQNVFLRVANLPFKHSRAGRSQREISTYETPWIIDILALRRIFVAGMALKFDWNEIMGPSMDGHVFCARLMGCETVPASKEAKSTIMSDFVTTCH